MCRRIGIIDLARRSPYSDKSISFVRGGGYTCSKIKALAEFAHAALM
jgi:hypothetical protein